MRLAIDASNLRDGGGVTHLVEILRAFDPCLHRVDHIDIWACRNTLAQIDDHPNITKHNVPQLEGSILKRLMWQKRQLGDLMRACGADLHFAPGGSIVADFRPAVTMSRNMLPFEWREMKRFGLSLTLGKMLLLQWLQSRSFRNADATIFLTRYARETVTRITGSLKGRSTVIPHGVNKRFVMAPRAQRALSQFTPDSPLKIVYVSTVDAFKHQWNVVRAVGHLRTEGLPVRLDLYGSARPSALGRLQSAIDDTDKAGKFIRFWGKVDYTRVHACYAEADMAVFASSCENMPNILIESMAAALPIACSDRGPMPEVLRDAGVYFDPESVSSIASAIRQLALSDDLRAGNAAAAAAEASTFSWTRCAKETFDFLNLVASSPSNASLPRERSVAENQTARS